MANTSDAKIAYFKSSERGLSESESAPGPRAGPTTAGQCTVTLELVTSSSKKRILLRIFFSSLTMLRSVLSSLGQHYGLGLTLELAGVRRAGPGRAAAAAAAAGSPGSARRPSLALSLAAAASAAARGPAGPCQSR